MRKSCHFVASWLIAVLVSIAANSQSISISGTVRNETSKENVPSVSVRVKGTTQGTYTNPDGEFTLKVDKLPVTLVFTSIGYDEQELNVTDAAAPIEISFKVNNSLGQEVVVSATRAPQRILESPVTIERLSAASLRRSPSATYYESLANLKGVDVHTASLTFRTVTTRGFVSSGNTRLNQLVDGMDNQAPGLNFSVSSIVGLTEQDVDNIEVLSGASSALYGSGGMNGTVLINSKNPFKYQGLSYNIKQGIMHTDGKQRSPAPYYNWSARYAKAFNNKFAYKITAELTKGSDWQADDYDNKQQLGVLSTIKSGNRFTDPLYNGVNVYGDETPIPMQAVAFGVQEATRQGILAATGGATDIVLALNNYFTAIGNPQYPSNTQISNFLAMLPAQIQSSVANMIPSYLGLRNGYIKNISVSRTGYNEEDLVDYNTLNFKLTAGLNWKITDNIEASWNTYFGTGTTVYTGANRYSLRNFKMAQHKLEFKAKNWMVRGYTTQENAGDSYIGDAVGSFLNEAYAPSATVWGPTYVSVYSEAYRQSMGTIDDMAAHNAARAQADANRLIPGTAAFNATAQQIKNKPVNQAGGSKFLDKSDLWAGEAQLNLSDAAHFSDKVEVIVGAQWKQWVMNSRGTIFADTSGAIKINETGGYIQLKKKFLNDILTLTASGRYDKQTNFDGKFTPRIAAVIKVANDNNLRVSYQTSYRFPTNQNQYINLRIGGGDNYLIGCIPDFQDFYKLNSTNVGYTAASVVAYRSGSSADSSVLVAANYNTVKPETVRSYEIGYKGILSNKVLIDAYVYYSKYENFLVNEAVVQSISGYKKDIYNSNGVRNLSYSQNSTQAVKSVGWGIGIDYNFVKSYFMYGNIFSDDLKDVAPGDITFFNAPKYRFNIGVRNDNICHNVGFNIVLKWQDKNYYEGTFVTGTLPAFTTIDAQVSYKPDGTKSTFRLGGSNIANKYNRTGYGSPAAGGLYYFSYGYNL